MVSFDGRSDNDNDLIIRRRKSAHLGREAVIDVIVSLFSERNVLMKEKYSASDAEASTCFLRESSVWK